MDGYPAARLFPPVSSKVYLYFWAMNLRKSKQTTITATTAIPCFQSIRSGSFSVERCVIVREGETFGKRVIQMIAPILPFQARSVYTTNADFYKVSAVRSVSRGSSIFADLFRSAPSPAKKGNGEREESAASQSPEPFTVFGRLLGFRPQPIVYRPAVLKAYAPFSPIVGRLLDLYLG
jgi:hypothetical protein